MRDATEEEHKTKQKQKKSDIVRCSRLSVSFFSVFIPLHPLSWIRVSSGGVGSPWFLFLWAPQFILCRERAGQWPKAISDAFPVLSQVISSLYFSLSHPRSGVFHRPVQTIGLPACHILDHSNWPLTPLPSYDSSASTPRGLQFGEFWEFFTLNSQPKVKFSEYFKYFPMG